MTASTVALAPVTKTVMRSRITRNGPTRPECWAAVTTDDVWDLEREDSVGTPWIVTHRPTGIWVGLCGTLRACQEYISSGAALAELERLMAHAQGDHADARDPRCGRC